MARKPLGLPSHLGPGFGLGRVVAIDLPGFGHSDGRPDLIAPDAAGAFLARLIDEWGLGAPHVVGPDVGTAAALFLAACGPAPISCRAASSGRVRPSTVRCVALGRSTA